MYKIDFNRPQVVHFIGIGGISMSGLAEVLLDRGFTIYGSDAKPSPLTKALEEKGARIAYGQRKANITDDIELAVYTAAIHPDNPEYVACQEKSIPMMTRAELLGQLMKNYQTAIAVAGTHGKTTTTSMLSQILLEAKTDPTISVGGILPAIGGNIRVGKSQTFITEACEYMDSFLSFFPTMGIILNMEEDHLDYFSGIDAIRQSFRTFARLIPPEGQLVICADTPCYTFVTEGLPCQVITFSLSPEAGATYYAKDIAANSNGCCSFTLVYQGQEEGRYQLKVPGRHNVSNALAAIAAAKALELPEASIQKGLDAFTGAERRFEYKGTVANITIIDDYAHHPTEIEATLKSAMDCAHHQIWCVFQPHTYSRTKALLDQFATALHLADHVVLADIYAARENDDLGISSRNLQEKIQALGTPCEYFPTFDAIESYLLSNAEPGDIIITMGAGDIYRVGEHLLGD